MATEIVTFPLRESDATGNAKTGTEEALRETLSIVTQQAGFQRAYWGREAENPSTVRLFVDWDSPQAHYDFMKHDDYKPFVEKLDETANVAHIQAFHAYLSPHPALEALNSQIAAISEVFTIYFPVDYSSTDQGKFEEILTTFVDITKRTAVGYAGVVKGWVLEDLPLPGTTEQAKAYLLCLGWQSQQAHLTFRETQSYKDNVYLWRQAKGIRHVEEIHFSGVQVNAGEKF